MGSGDSSGSGKGGLFSAPSLISLDDLLGPSGTPAEKQSPDSPLVRYVPLLVDVSETGESDTPVLSRPEPKEEAPAVVQFVPEAGGAEDSEFISESESDSGAPQPKHMELDVSLRTLTAAPDHKVLAQIRFPKPELSEISSRDGARTALTPLVTPSQHDSGADPAVSVPDGGSAMSGGQEPDTQGRPPGGDRDRAASQDPPDDSSPDEPSSGTGQTSDPARENPLNRSDPLIEADWGDEAILQKPQTLKPLQAQVEAVTSSGISLSSSQPDGDLPRQMVAPPPSSEPLHPAVYLLLMVLGVLAVLAFAIPMLS
jgi:hypothetical protein